MTTWTHQWQEVADSVANEGGAKLYAFLAHTDITQQLLEVADEFPKSVALWDNGRPITYEELIRDIKSFAVNLRRVGVFEGDRVVMFMPNSIELVQAFFSCLFLGAIAVPLNPALGLQEREQIFANVHPNKILSLRDVLGNDPQVMVMSPEGGEVAFPDLRGRESDDIIPVAIQSHRIAVILYTSGTTGMPKGVVLTNLNLLMSTVSYQRIFRLSHRDRTLVAVPLFHVTGLVGQMLAILLVGGTVFLLRKFSAGQYFGQIRSHRITFVFAVPTILTLAFYQYNGDITNFETLRVIASGGAPIATELVSRILDVFPNAKFFNTYGMTEVASPATILPAELARAHMDSVGFPVPGMQLRVVGLDSQTDQGPGRTGELWVRGPMMTPGYWDHPEATGRAFCNGWLRTGDLASIDAQGLVRIDGRIKEMINRGGEKVYPADVERPLLQHPAIMQAVVFGVPDDIWGERVQCAVCFKPGMSATGDDLAYWLKQRVARFKVPDHFLILAQLPLNANGKVDKQWLIAQARPCH